MFERIIKFPQRSFILIGPRGTGKTTWLKRNKFNLIVDLLVSRDRIKLLADPHYLSTMVSGLKKGDWMLIDEVQKIPELLEEVHHIYEEKKINFVLSGSSPRKLKRLHANLLAARAINLRMFPFVHNEIKNEIPIEDRILYGTLPVVVDADDYRKETLETYVENYLQQELMEERVVRRIDSFLRFLNVAGQLNGQILNVKNISRECSVPRTTVDGYFDILFETLIAFRLPAYRPGLKVKEISNYKFYFFDSGVARSCAGLIREELDKSYVGYLFETYLLHEVRAYNEYAGKKRELFFYGINNSFEIDLIIQLKKKTISTPEEVIAVEFKYQEKWKQGYNRPLNSFGDNSKIKVKKVMGVYCGKLKLVFDDIVVYPVEQFLELLWEGEFF